MDLTSHKERHIIKCLGLAHREEKCGMSPADREEDLMLFIREHLPETAFSPFALDTAPPPLQSAHRRADTGRKRSLLGVLPPHALFPVPSISLAPRPRFPGCLAPSLAAPLSAMLPTPMLPTPVFLPQTGFVALKAPVPPALSTHQCIPLQPHLPFSPDPMPPAGWLQRFQDTYRERPLWQCS